MHYYWECRLVQPLWRHLKKLKVDLPFNPAIPLLGIYLKEPKTLIQKNISTPMFIAVSFTITKIWKQPKCPSVDEWSKPLWDIYTMEYYSVIKKKKVLPSVTAWMDLENIMLSEISQSEKSKYHMIHSCVASNEQTELTRKMWTDHREKEDRWGERLATGGIEQKGKRADRHRQQCGDCNGGRG